MTDGRRRATLLVLAALVPATMMGAIALGSVRLPLGGVLPVLLAKLHLASPAALDATTATIVWEMRVPRVLLAAMVGGGLAVVGAVLQAVFRNPIADSSLLGVSSGAALGAVLAVRLGLASVAFLSLPCAAFVGALGAVALVYSLAHSVGRATLHGLLLTGLAVSAMASAVTSMLLVATEEYRIKVVLFWLSGGLDGRSWAHVQIAAAFILPAVALLVVLARPLDVLSLGDEEAASLGLRVHLTRLVLLTLAALVTGASTAIAGSVPFVGLIAPHALRPQVGSLGRHLLPAAFLAGAVLVVVADLAARTLNEQMDLPLGSLTALVGAPYFLIAVRGSERRS
jgi:iron complex transport system permease protein